MGRRGRSRVRFARDEYVLGPVEAAHRIVHRAAESSLPPPLHAQESSSSEEEIDEPDPRPVEGVDPPLLDEGEGERGE